MRLNVRQLFVLILFIALFIMTLRPVADPDFWWHLRTGQLIAQTRVIPHSDPFSYTNFGKVWTAHEWLAELGFYSLYRLGGFGFLILVFAVIMTGAYLFTYLACSEGSRPYAAGFAILFGALASAPAWGVRPQMISLIFFALANFLLDRYQHTRKNGFLIPLPILTLLWVNLHAGYFLLFAAVGIHMAGETFDYLLALRRREQPSARPFLALGATLAASALTALANPNGFHILVYPFQTLTSPSMQQFIQEWFSPDFHQSQWQPLAWFFLALIGTTLLARRPVPLSRLMLTVFFGYAALQSMRNVPLFAVAAIPVLAEQLTSFFGTRTQVQAMPRFTRWLNPAIVVIAFLLAGFQFLSTVSGQTLSERENFPAGAADWILENHPSGNLFNTYGWGGYLIWRLYPGYPVYIDGRADLYGDDFIYDYVGIYQAGAGWQAKLDAAQVDTVVIEKGEPLANAMAESPLWIVAFQDDASIIFVRKSAPPR
jgi:hypothetical protein